MDLTRNTRPERFRLNASHPLAQGLVFAGLGNNPGSERYYDSSVYQRHGTGIFASTGARSGIKIGRQMLLLRGHTADDYITLPNAPATSGGGFTFSCWYLSTDTDADNQYVVSVTGSTDNRLNITDTQCVFEYADSMETSTAYTNADDGTLVHFAYFRPPFGTTVYFYKNGQLADSQYNTGLGGVFTFDRIGINGYGADEFDGYIGDIVLHDRALSLSEIQTLADPSNIMLDGLIKPAYTTSFGRISTQVSLSTIPISNYLNVFKSPIFNSLMYR